MMKTLIRVNFLGVAALALFLSFPTLADTEELPLSFRQRVETSEVVLAGTVLLPRDGMVEPEVLVEEVLHGDTSLALTVIVIANDADLPGSRLLALLGAPRTEVREINGITQLITIYDVKPDGLFNLDETGNDVLKEAADRYAQVAMIGDPQQRAQALVSASITALASDHPVLLSGAALDLQTIPKVTEYLSESDHDAIAQAVLRTHNGFDYKRDLLDAAGATRSVRSVGAMVFSLTRPNSANIREAAGRNLAYINAETSADLLLRQMRDPRNGDAEIQASLAHVLGAIKNNEAIPYLMAKSMNGNDRDLRVESMLALGKIQNQSAIPILQQNHSDPDPVIVRASLQALAWLDQPPAYDVLRNFEANASDPRMKLLAQMLLKVPNRTIAIY